MVESLTISLDHGVVRSPGNIVSDMDGETVLLSVENGKYYNLGEIGGRVWELVETPTTVNQLVTTLLSEYDVEQKVCEEQVISFLNHLLEEQLIHLEKVDPK